MSDYNEGVNFRCQVCLSALTDIPLEKNPDGSFRCLKCSYTGSFEDIIARYAQFRSKYTLRKERLTLEMQREL